MAAKLLLLIPIYGALYLLVLAQISKKTAYSWKFLVSSFCKGILAVFPLLALKYSDLLDKNALIISLGIVWTYFFLALLEELNKEASFLLHREKFDKHKKIFCCIAVACGFAFIENIIFATHFYSTGGMVLIAGTRFILNSTIHATCMALTVLYLERLKTMLPGTSKSILHFLSVLPATIVHSVFNLLYVWKVGYISVPLVVSCILLMNFMYKQHFFDNVEDQFGPDMEASPA